jgi:hypothetical protein
MAARWCALENSNDKTSKNTAKSVPRLTIRYGNLPTKLVY